MECECARCRTEYDRLEMKWHCLGETVHCGQRDCHTIADHPGNWMACVICDRWACPACHTRQGLYVEWSNHPDHPHDYDVWYCEAHVEIHVAAERESNK